MVKNIACIGALVGWAGLAVAQAPATPVLSEKDFLADMPIVLSVSRLPQRLDETPGAVTILDKDMIRRSGARDVSDLLRMVPGFQTVASFERGAPVANYHGSFDGYSYRIQVLIDGRSVYSPYFFGGTGFGLQSVSLADIERIEVLRGSNSAAYGARAMLGVINIVTQHTVDTLGLQATLGAGENGVRDAQARIGWNYGDASFRLSVDRRADKGLVGSNGHNQVSRVNFRSDLQVNGNDELQLRAGGMGLDAGVGWPTRVADALHDRSINTSYGQLNWRHTLGPDEDVLVSASHTEEKHVDNFPYAPVPGLLIDFGGRATNDALLLQKTSRHGADVRLVMGGELRREKVVSKPVYNTDSALVTDFTRLFGHAEWRFAPQFILNAGGLYEKSNVGPDTFSPRVMVNWQAAEGQTFRMGVSRAYRPPSTFEKYGDVRYAFNGAPLQIVTLARGNVDAETLLVRELGYLGQFLDNKISVDVRAFQENMGGRIKRMQYDVPAGTTLLPSKPYDFVNGESMTIKGLEYEVKWRPWRDAQIILGQTYVDLDSSFKEDFKIAPTLASTLNYFHKLPGGLDLSLMYSKSSPARLVSSSLENVFPKSRTDLRVAWPVRIGRTKGEVAAVVQNLGSPYRDLDPVFKFERRAFVTLELEN